MHPLLQALHRGSGSLHGTISLSTGRGIAALVGRRLARRLGLPLQREHCGFAVRIAHEAGALLWQRRFDGGAQMISRFVPYGTFPDGGWHEQTGPLQLDLGVDISDGGWHWRLRGARWNGLPLPTLLLPRTDAANASSTDATSSSWTSACRCSAAYCATKARSTPTRSDARRSGAVDCLLSYSTHCAKASVQPRPELRRCTAGDRKPR
ncbi:DUF4166 domain-containing protein [Tahibacter sp. UC22_41]|uniref:DUF4166 domain-containing protein n=1 Tax=Tahibacter sp. UC22_41 TaxID=3350178 RepID=UPI0036DF53DB